MTKSNTLIQFTLIQKRGRRVVSTQPCWLASVNYADGPGMTVKKMSTTKELDRAARFPLETAEAIAVQFSHLPASLVSPDGSVLVEETARLRAAQLARHERGLQTQREFNAALNEALAPVLEIMKSVRR